MIVGDPELIVETIKSLKKEGDAIESQITDICYHMNGGVTWNEAWQMSHASRDKVIKNISKKLEKMSGKEYL